MKRHLTLAIIAIATAAALGVLCAFTVRPGGGDWMLPGLSFARIEVLDHSLPDFEVSITEITNEQYAAFLSAVGRGSGVWFDKHGTEPGNLPARNLTRDNAMEFCRWLTHELRVRGIIAWNQVITLPTDAQFSAVIGLKPGAEQGATPEEKMKNATLGSFYHGLEPVPPVDAANVLRILDSNVVPPVKVGFEGNSDGYVGVAPVGRFKTPGSPVYDIAGNVAEYVRDNFNAAGTVCVRGGNFKTDTAAGLSVSRRDSVAAGSSSDNVGFRVVLETLPMTN